jgi:Na+-driven multidrug efflux pump
MGDVIRLFGMNERVVQMGVDYTKVAIFDYILEGISDSYSVLLDISGYAVPATIYDIVAGASDCIILWLLLAFYDGANLFWVAVAMLASNIFFFVLFAVIAICLGWLDPFWNGMIKSCAFKVSAALKYLDPVATINIHRIHNLSIAFYQNRTQMLLKMFYIQRSL